MDETPATIAVAESGLDHEVLRYGRVDSIEEAAEKRGVPLARVIKTIVVRKGGGSLLMVLVPGDRVIDWPKLRNVVGASRMALARAGEALEATGYRPGTITPLGSSTALPVVADAALDGLASVGGGAPGVAINVDAAALIDHLDAMVADVTKPAS
jgi:Cys-tRNA(Pro)/Cys-tRNA(Cys) deacylase